MADRKTLIACEYRPPNTSIIHTNLLIKYLNIINKIADAKIYVGDYNFPHINREQPALTKRKGSSVNFQATTGNTH